MAKIKIRDESGDRKYFTQIPNMIVNHSTAYEQSLYLIMKRLAGENGSCYASLNFLSKKMGIHKTTVSKTITKLLNRNWVKEAEKKQVRGGQVRQFIIVDLWKANIKEYESGAKMTTSTESGAVVDESGAVVDGSGAKSDTKKSYEEDNEEHHATPKVVAVEKPFNLEEEIDKLVEGKVEHLSIIGLYIDIKELKPTNRAQFSSIIKRNSRVACAIKGYAREQIINTMSLLAKYADFKWTIESVGKFIDNPDEIKKLKK